MKDFIIKNGIYHHVSGKYRLRERKGRNIEVAFTSIPGRWESTGSTDLYEAAEFANSKLANNGIVVGNYHMLFKDFAKDFFDRTDDDSYLHRLEAFGKSRSESSIRLNSQKLKRHIMPFFKDYTLDGITPQIIENWYISLCKRDRKPMANNSKLSILNSMSIIMNEACRKGIIQHNPCREVERVSAISKPKETFSKEEISKLFPAVRKDLVDIWSVDKDGFHIALMNATYFSILVDTGFRPSEALAIGKSSIVANGVYIERSIDHATNKIKNSIKTSAKGQKFKTGILSKYTLSLIKDLSEYTEGEYFFMKNGKFVEYYHFAHRLEMAMKKAGIEPNGRTPYCFRHTFDTYMLSGDADRKDVQLLMGHMKYRPEYDHRTADILIGKLQAITPIIEDLRKTN